MYQIVRIRRISVFVCRFTERFRDMFDFSILISNPLINVAVVSWCAAQILKTSIHLFKHGEFKKERLSGAGGMPSSHSAVTCSVLLTSYLIYGFSSPIFAMAFVLALIVMYDATGVRWAAGLQDVYKRQVKLLAVEAHFGQVSLRRFGGELQCGAHTLPLCVRLRTLPAQLADRRCSIRHALEDHALFIIGKMCIRDRLYALFILPAYVFQRSL